MNTNTKVMLKALSNSSNGNTREHAIDILENRAIEWAQGIPAEDLAVAGRLGGLLQRVMTGDLRDAWGAADLLNQHAMSDVIPEAYRHW